MTALVVADIHANMDALTAVLDAAAGSYDEIWCLGDVVGYGPQPREALVMVKRQNPIAVAGNHDRAAVGMMDLRWFNDGARYAAERHAALLTDEGRQWLIALPDLQTRGSFTLCHGSLADPIRGYIIAAHDAAQTLDLAQTPVVLTGHTHVPAIWRRRPGGGVERERIVLSEPTDLADGVTIVNPGSLGQPRDGNPDACYTLVDTDENTITFKRAAYPVDRVMQKMRDHGYPESSITRYRGGR